MINLIANEEFKKLGCVLKAGQWTPPKLAKKEFLMIQKKFFEDLIAVEIKINEGFKLKRKGWGTLDSSLVAGYVVATVQSRDSGARLAKDICVLEGKFDSTGSIKNYFCDHTNELVLRLYVSKNILDLLDKEVLEERYSYKIIDDDENFEQDLIQKMGYFSLEELEKEIKRRKEY